MPGTIVGVILGALLLILLRSNANLVSALIRIEIGCESILLVSIHWWRMYRGVQQHLMLEPWRSGLTGGFAAVSSTLAHAAGPIIVMYLLPLRLDRQLFVGTCAVYFFILNTAKLPAYYASGQFAHAAISFTLRLLPLVVAGAILAAGSTNASATCCSRKSFTSSRSFWEVTFWQMDSSGSSENTSHSPTLLGVLSDTHDRADAAAAGIATLRRRRRHNSSSTAATWAASASSICWPEFRCAFVWGNNDYDRASLTRYAVELGLQCGGDFAELQFAGKKIAVTHGDSRQAHPQRHGRRCRIRLSLPRPHAYSRK